MNNDNIGLWLLVYCLLAALGLCIFYLIIKSAVKNGVKEAVSEMRHVFPETVSGPVYSEPVSTPVYTAPVYSMGPFEITNRAFSKINIALGVLFSCGYGVSLISLVLGIIALVFTAQAGKAATLEEAQQKLNSAKIMNIIGAAFLVLGVIITIIVVAVQRTST